MNLSLFSLIALAGANVALDAHPGIGAAPLMTIALADQTADDSAAPSPSEPALRESQTQSPKVANSADTAATLPLEDPLVFESESDETVAEKLITYIEDLDTLSGDFTQIAPSGAVSSGKFYLRRPGLLRFDYEPPTPLLIVANGGLVYVRDNDLETTDSYPVGKTPLKFLLSKEVDRDEAQVVAVDRGVDNVAVTFSSTDEETEGELTLIANAPDFELRRWIVRDLQGGVTVVTLDNVKSGERLANSLFRAPDSGGRFLDR
ncbi:LolA family protein [Hyphococcus sp.]|uniref:LolA family protein n=1 Tax=Hyphococcus sp. TaxID=2038636 RepID=UPI003CCC40FE